MAVLLWAYSPGPFLMKVPQTVNVAIYAILAIIGIAVCYRANKKGDNADFIVRMMCLGLPVGIQSAFPYAIVFLTAGVIESLPAAALGPLPFANAMPCAALKVWRGVLADAVVVGFSTMFFRIVYDHIAFAAKVKSAENTPAFKQTKCSSEHVIFGMLSGNVIAVVILLLAGRWVPFDDHPFGWRFLTLLAVMLWTVAFVALFSRYRRRSIEHA